MIVECSRCRTKYRFDRDSIRGDGAWLRCTRCRHVFFLRNPEKGEDLKRDEITAGLAEKTGPVPVEETRAAPLPEEPPREDVPEVEEVLSPEEAASKEAEQELEKLFEESEVPEVEKTSLLKKLFLFFLLLIVLSGGFFLLQPEAAKSLFRRVTVSIQKILPWAQKETVFFTAVEERFLTNTAAGNLMVVRGVAVNNTGGTLPPVRVRARILDSTGKTVREVTSNGGNILTEEELRTLDLEEMTSILSTPEGRDYPNAQIPAEGTVPFMIVIPDPPENAAEYTIDTAASP